MKTEKKSSEPSCVPPVIVKDDPSGDPDRVKIKEETGGTGNPDDATGTTDTTDQCLKDAVMDAAASVAVADGTIGPDNQNGNAAQTLLNPKKEENDSILPSEDLPPVDCPPNLGMSVDSIQPLVSNVLGGKQMGGGPDHTDVQYMQQHNAVFVFSTKMANQCAEAVMRGEYPSVISYHMAQPGTKKFLEMMNNFADMKQKGHPPNPNMGFPGEQPPDLPALDPSKSAFWNEQPNICNLNGSNPLGNPDSSLDDKNNVPCIVPNSPHNTIVANPPPLGVGAPMGHSPNLMGGTTSPGPGGVQPSLQGVKVPDENLTPQQRAHREKQLATITKMQQMLFPEHKEIPGGPMDPHGQMPGGICPTSNLPPVSAPNQCGGMVMDWQKYLDGKSKVGVSSPGVQPIRGASGGIVGTGGGPGNMGLGPIPTCGSGPGSNVQGPIMTGNGPRSQGPPPPYHQTTRSASVPIATQSPNPSSPNNPTSNLSLPSPRASSALNSPADCNRQFQLGGTATGGPRHGGPGHLSGHSPTSQDSPNPVVAAANRLNHSNPGTPVSHQHLAALSPSGTPQKDPSTLDFPNNQPPTVDGMFCRSLQTLAQQKQALGPGVVNQVGVKELMPVPSPQQISYLNTFEGQELTIQKQPNTSLKDGSLPTNTQGSNNQGLNSQIMTGNMDANSGVGGTGTTTNNQFNVPRSEGASPSIESANRSGFGSMHSPHTPHTPHTPGSVAPHTPIDAGKQSGNKSQSAQSSPASHNTSLTDMGMGPPRTIPASPSTKSETSPSSKDLQQHQQQMQQQQQNQQQPSGMPGMMPNQPGNIPGGMMPGSMGMAGSGGNTSFSCVGGRSMVNVSQPNENVPLNPNNIGNRLGGLGGPMSTNSFDPITSLAQMSQQLTNPASNNSHGNDGSPLHTSGTGQPGMMPFNNPHNMPNMMQAMPPQQQPPPSGSQQQMNEMNGNCHMPGAAGIPTSESADVSGLCMGLGGPNSGYSPNPHAGSPGMPNKMNQHNHPMMQQVNMNMNQPGGYPSGPGPGPQAMMGGPEGPQSRMGMPGQQHPHHQQQPPHHQHVHGPSPYNGANIQVKPSAPNTIQYLPARPNVGHAPRGPPSLEFLRYANPMPGMDAKMNSPSVNLQYFPNGCMPNNMGLGPGGPQGQHGPMGGGPAGPGPMPPGMSGGMNQSGMGGQPQGPMHPSMRPVVAGPTGPQGPGVRQQPNIMRMQHMAAGGSMVFPNSPMDPDKVFPPDIGPGGAPQMPGQTASPGMYGGPMGPGQKQPGPMGQLGPPPPDATQPLPPSMGGAGGASNFKNSPFMSGGPSMSDPNYAQQYHNFQQQLYATGTRGSGPQGHPAMHNQSNAHQQYFMPK